MDEIMQDPEHPDKDCLIYFDTKALRDTRELLVAASNAYVAAVASPHCAAQATAPLSEAYQFVLDRPHPRLWTLLAE